MQFCLEVGRARIDLDNLVRPALDALRDAGVFGRGFRDLDALVAAKAAASPVGLGVMLMTAQETGSVRPLAGVLLTLEHGGLPRDGNRVAKVRWREAVAQAWPYAPLQGLPVVLDVRVSTSLSFKDLLKPIIDGLEPVLGRDPRGHLEFSPNDHLITGLRMLRSPGPPTLSMQLAPLGASD